jgi:AraC-like DNA-binding protein
MKILQTEIAPKINSMFSVMERKESFFSAPLHVHPEYELVYIKESYGKRIIGNQIERFEAGDMVLIGPSLPHIWINDDSFVNGQAGTTATSIVLYFHPQLFECGLFDLPEAEHLKNMLRVSKLGIAIKDETRNKVAEKIEALLHVQGFQRIMLLLEILHLLAESAELSQINATEFVHYDNKSEKDRLCEVYRYVHENFRSDIQLKDVARLTNLTPQSFCRLFKKRNNLHFVEYLNQVRISNACRLLLDSDWTISEIAYNCGYKTISNFNKLFKETTGLSPKRYREQAILNLPLQEAS